MIKTYYLLTKPGIIMGNAITTASGFALASRGHFDFWLFLATVIGLSLVVASACVFNNYIDRRQDSLMERTKERPLVKGIISETNALLFATALALLSLFILIKFTNPLAVTLAFTGFFIYVVLYGMWKSRTIYGTAIGSISGAMPPIVGYCAAGNQLDSGAVLLFFILVLWQMPHFFAIAVFHLDDYIAASIPVLPVLKGMEATKKRMLIYIVGFMFAVMMLSFLGYTGYAFFITGALLSLNWLRLCLKGFKMDNDQLWARKMFRFSLLTISFLCLMMSLDAV